eukprot:Skav218385  [mRNA]  locus=scaffold2066:399024:400865:- [translate_table: standard]
MLSTETPEDVGRSCTDAGWCFPFLACFAFLIWAYYYAVDHGNLLELTGLPNGDGLICGVSEPVAAAPFLYLCPSAMPAPSDLVCVAQCPLSIEGSLTAAACQNSAQPDYPSIAVADKVCFPTDSARLSNLNRLAFRFGGLDCFLAAVVEIQKAWPVFILSGILVVAISFMYLKLFTQDPSTVFWANTGFFTVVFGFIGAVSVIDAVDLETGLGDAWNLLTNVEFLLGTTALLVVLFFHICVFLDRQNLKNAFQAVKACGECSRDVPAILTEPALAAARKVLLLTNFAVGLMFFASGFDRVPNGSTYEIHYKAKDLWIAAGFVLCFMWVYDFSNAISCFVYAYMSATWFYAPMVTAEEKDFEGATLLTDAYWAIAENHLGSLAVGSLVILVMRPVRVVLDLITRPVRKADDEHPNMCAKCANSWPFYGKICSGLIDFYQRRIRMLRRSAYMDIAMSGHGFWSAAYEADGYLAGKNVNVSEFDGAALLVATSSSFSISALGAALTRLLCAVWPDYSSTSSPNLIMMPTFVTFVSFAICMLISWPFCLLSDHVADSLFFCFCRDASWYGGGGGGEERNRGCNLQSIFGGAASQVAVLTSSHPSETQALKNAFDQMT